MRSFSVVLNSAKRDANGFFKVLLLSSHLLSSRHPVQKSKFGTRAVTGYCSFNYFSFHVLFSKCSYCDVTQENRFLQISAFHLSAYVRIIKKEKYKGKGKISLITDHMTFIWETKHTSHCALVGWKFAKNAAPLMKVQNDELYFGFIMPHVSSFRPQIMEKIGKILTISRPSSTCTLGFYIITPG